MELDKIFNLDCNRFMALCGNPFADLVLTSPPYNMTKRPGGISDKGRYDCYVDWMSESDYISFSKKLFNGFDKVVKTNGLVIYNFSYSIENPSLPYKLVASIQTDTVWGLVDTIVWKKKCGIPFPANERRLSRNWEFVWIFARKSEIDTFNIYKGVKSVSSKTGQKYYNLFYNMIEAANNDGETRDLNQATFSSDLCIKLFEIYAKKGNVIYDPFMGTGTTAVAAVKYGCRFVGTEISENQVLFATDRVNREKEKMSQISFL